MTLDAPLVAAATLQAAGGRPGQFDSTRQLQLAHVLLDGGYDGVSTIEEALSGGDHGLGTLDRLDGELVVVDGEPWQVDYHGMANRVPPQARTPFVVVSTLDSPATVRLRDVDRAGVAAAIDDLAPDPTAVLSVRLEGHFNYVLVRSVPPQDPPYRPYAEVCATDEVRWEHHSFYGVFVGFRFPDLTPGATIPGLHLHGLDRLRTTGGHNHDLRVADALLSVSVSRDVVVQLPERSMMDLLSTPAHLRAVQRVLLRSHGATVAAVAEALDITPSEARTRLEWLSDRGYVTVDESVAGEPMWRTALRTPAARTSAQVAALLDSL